MTTRSTKIGASLAFALAVLVTALGTAATQSSITPGRINNQNNKPIPPHTTQQNSQTLSILVDDFIPQPLQGETTYFYNRIGGDRGAINNSALVLGQGLVTTTVAAGNTWGGVWMNLNHPARDGQSVNFSAILPSQISPPYQSKITGLTIRVAGGTAGKRFKIELKNGNDLHWTEQFTLSEEPQVFSFDDLPPLGDITTFVWVIDQATAGDFVVVENVALTATTQITDTALASFVWSYGMLLNNMDPATALVRDKARDGSGDFSAIQVAGSLAAATAMAEQLGVINHADAVQIITQIGNVLLYDVPRYQGLWPHFTERIVPSGVITIAQNTEWSSVDTVIAAISLLEAQRALNLDTSDTEQMLKDINWDDLLVPEVGISHGYTYTGTHIPTAWDTFGGESWLVDLAYAASKKEFPPLKYPFPPTANGSGFIDDLAWLYLPPPTKDKWGVDWTLYRHQATITQTSYYPNLPNNCFDELGLFGLSAAEVPAPSAVVKPYIYQPFGVGGQWTSSPNDGSALLTAPVVVPHYSAMIASLRPMEATHMWAWLIAQGFFSPLNNVESLMFPADSDCSTRDVQWNHLKGSWNLALQTLGWGRYLAERQCKVPILWQAMQSNTFLRDGYNLLADAPNLSICKTYMPIIQSNHD